MHFLSSPSVVHGTARSSSVKWKVPTKIFRTNTRPLAILLHCLPTSLCILHFFCTSVLDSFESYIPLFDCTCHVSRIVSCVPEPNPSQALRHSDCCFATALPGALHGVSGFCMVRRLSPIRISIWYNIFLSLSIDTRVLSAMSCLQV